MTYNPSLREEPRSQKAAVIPVQQEASILDWLESTGRLLARDVQDPEVVAEEADDINEFISDDDSSFDLDDDDDELDLED
jgi:Protein of unknown function (DUF3134)